MPTTTSRKLLADQIARTRADRTRGHFGGMPWSERHPVPADMTFTFTLTEPDRLRGGLTQKEVDAWVLEFAD